MAVLEVGVALEQVALCSESGLCGPAFLSLEILWWLRNSGMGSGKNPPSHGQEESYVSFLVCFLNVSPGLLARGLLFGLLTFGES